MYLSPRPPSNNRRNPLQKFRMTYCVSLLADTGLVILSD